MNRIITCAFKLALIIEIVFCSLANANIVNGSFETGDLTGWSAVIPVGGSINIVGSHTDPMTYSDWGGPTVYGTTSWTPTEGNVFALLKTDGPGSITQLYQSFTAAAGDTLTFDYFWDSQDFVPYDDTCTGKLLSGEGIDGPVVAELFYHNVGSSYYGSGMGTDPGNFYGTPWISVSYDITTAGTYTLLITNMNAIDSGHDSYVGIDNVFTPVPAAILLGILGLGVAGIELRKFA